MDIYRVTISKAELGQLPEPGQMFFICAGNLLNDLNTLQKCVLYSNFTSQSEVERRVQLGTSLFFSRLTASKCWEGWLMLQKAYFGTRLSKDYQNLISMDGQKALQQLKLYFSGENLIKEVRNRFEFHSPDQEALRTCLAEVSDDEIFEIYIAESQGNCRFQLSDVLITSAAMKLISVDRGEAMFRLLKEPVDVAGNFIRFLMAWIHVFLAKHLDEKELVTIANPPSLEEVRLPFFISKRNRGLRGRQS
jgi:hypothetical protein